MEIKMRWEEKLDFHALCSLTNFRVPKEASRLFSKNFLSGNAKKKKKIAHECKVSKGNTKLLLEYAIVFGPLGALYKITVRPHYA